MSTKLVLLADGKDVKAYELTQERHVMGRKHDLSDMTIEHPSLSRKHFSISKLGEAFQLEDLQSTSGTYVNGKKITKYFLNDGDEILAGLLLFRFSNPPPPPVPVDSEMTMMVPDGDLKAKLEAMRKSQLAQRHASPASGGAPNVAASTPVVVVPKTAPPPPQPAAPTPPKAAPVQQRAPTPAPDPRPTVVAAPLLQPEPVIIELEATPPKLPNFKLPEPAAHPSLPTAKLATVTSPTPVQTVANAVPNFEEPTPLAQQKSVAPMPAPVPASVPQAVPKKVETRIEPAPVEAPKSEFQPLPKAAARLGNDLESLLAGKPVPAAVHVPAAPPVKSIAPVPPAAPPSVKPAVPSPASAPLSKPVDDDFISHTMPAAEAMKAGTFLAQSPLYKRPAAKDEAKQASPQAAPVVAEVASSAVAKVAPDEDLDGLLIPAAAATPATKATPPSASHALQTKPIPVQPVTKPVDDEFMSHTKPAAATYQAGAALSKPKLTTTNTGTTPPPPKPLSVPVIPADIEDQIALTMPMPAAMKASLLLKKSPAAGQVPPFAVAGAAKSGAYKGLGSGRIPAIQPPAPAAPLPVEFEGTITPGHFPKVMVSGGQVLADPPTPQFEATVISGQQSPPSPTAQPFAATLVSAGTPLRHSTPAVAVPGMMAVAAAGAWGEMASPVAPTADEKQWGMLACLLNIVCGLVGSVLGLAIRPQSPFVKFYALQGLFVFGVVFAMALLFSIFFMMLSLVGFGGLVLMLIYPFNGIFSLAFLGLCVFLGLKANNGVLYRIPLLGSLAYEMSYGK